MAEGNPDRAENSGKAQAVGPAGWQVSLGRILGSAARLATRGPAAWGGAWSSKRPTRKRGRQRAPEPVSVLLGKLGELVRSCESETCAGLAENPAFWQLVARLHSQRPRWRPGVAKKRRRVVDTADVAPANPDPDGSVEPDGMGEDPAAQRDPVDATPAPDDSKDAAPDPKDRRGARGRGTGAKEESGDPPEGEEEDGAE